VFVAVTILTQFLAYQHYLIGKDTENQKVGREINAVKDRLKTSLSYSLSATKTLAFLIKKYGVPADFDSVASIILASSKDIDALQLTREGVITHVYPLKGNEAAIGLNVLQDSVTNREAFLAIKKKELFFAGPFELRQGGLGVVGRLPIFMHDKFWGFSVVLIKLSTLLDAAGIDTLQDDFVYQLSKINPRTLKEEFFLPHPIHDARKFSSIEIPDGKWKVYVMPKSNNKLFYNAVTLSILGLILSGTGGVLAWQLARQPEKLNRLVNKKTIQLAKMLNVSKEKETTLNRINDSVVALDREWRYTFINDAALHTHPLSRDETLGKVIWEVHPGMKGTIFQEKYYEAMRTRKVIEFQDYYAPMDQWFFVKVYPSSDGLTIFYNNITERKKAEEQIAAEKILSESVINSLPGIFYLYDRKGKFIRWNKNFEIITGYSAEEISTLHPLDFFTGDEIDLIREKIDNVFTTGNSTDVTAHLCIKSKKTIPYYFNGSRANFGGTEYLIGMGIDITDRVEAENRLRERAEEIQKLTAHLQSIREEERTHIAREIHDVLGQQLTALKMDASWTARKIGDENKDICARISGMIALIDETVKTVRRISSELRPGILDDLGLTAALEWQGQDFEKHTGIKSEFHTDLHDFYPERNLSTNIFRVYQEALTNVARHAGATKVETTLEEKEGCIILVIKDNGTGFDMEQAKNKKSLGLIGMRERALLFQGELAVKSERDKGTVITLKIPWVETAKRKV
jgi:PAS domain S-box-containing protein